MELMLHSEHIASEQYYFARNICTISYRIPVLFCKLYRCYFVPYTGAIWYCIPA